MLVGGGGATGGREGYGRREKKGREAADKETKRYERRENGVRKAGDCDPPAPPPPPPHMLVHYNFLPPIQKLIAVLVLYSVADLLASLLSAPE